MIPARRPIVIAHRGASGYRPEHSAAAYELAIELGADAVEPDLVPSRDGVLVIRHENDISATTDVADRPEFAGRRTTKRIDGRQLTGWFTEDFDWAELATLRVRERLPKLRSTAFDDRFGLLRFSDLLSMLDARAPRMGLVAELKHADHFERLGYRLDELLERELARAGWAGDDRVTVECFELGVLRRLVARPVVPRTVFLIEAEGSPADEEAVHGKDARSFASYLDDAGLAEVRASGVVGISPDKRILVSDPGLVARAQAAGLLVYTWTLRAENPFLESRHRLRGEAFGDWEAEFGYFFALGVDGVFADQPDLALRAREAVEGRG